MILDLYALQPNIDSDWGPRLLSLDYNFLFHPDKLSCHSYAPLDTLEALASSLFPNKDGNNGSHSVLQVGSAAADFVKNELSEARKAVDKARGVVIDKYNVGSKENIEMMKLQNYLDHLYTFLTDVQENGWDIQLVTHNAHPKLHPNSTKGSKIPFAKRNDIRSNNIVGINEASLYSVDGETGTVTGDVLWSDYLERIDPTSKFIGHFVPKNVGYQPFMVRDANEDGLKGGNDFTYIPEFNKQIEQYILPLVVKTFAQVYEKPPALDTHILLH